MTQGKGMFGGRENGREEVPFEEYDVILFELGEAAERQFLEEGSTMKSIQIDRSGGGFSVTIVTGISAPKVRQFATFAEADAFAISKMGLTGFVIDNTRAGAAEDDPVAVLVDEAPDL